MTVKRDAAGKVERLVVKQPEGEFGFKNLAASGASGPGMTADELMAKVVQASGGEANIKKITSRVLTFNIDFVHQGVQAHGTTWVKPQSKTATDMIITALGKTIALDYDYFDGTGGQDISTFGPPAAYTGKRLADARRAADLYADLHWKDDYTKIDVLRVTKCGDEDCYAVAFTPKEGTKFTEYFSTKSFLLLKREGVQTAATMAVEIPYTVTFSDYREVDGLKVPFKQVTATIANGDVVTTVTSLKHNVPVDDAVFAAKKLKL